MSFQQLLYIIEVSRCNSINQAAKNLFLSQTALSSSIKALEEELGTILIIRSNKGIEFTEVGKEFVNHAISLIEQQKAMLNLFTDADKYKPPVRLNISSQRFFFAQTAVINYANSVKDDDFSVNYNEGNMSKVIGAVRDHKSDVGIISIADKGKKMIMKSLENSELDFKEIISVEGCVFFGVNNPMIKLNKIDETELLKYPYVYYVKEQDVPCEFAEEYNISSSFKPTKSICCNSCNSVLNLMYNTNGYTIGSGIIGIDVADKLISIPITEDKPIHIGYVTRHGESLSKEAKDFIKYLIKATKDSVDLTNKMRKKYLNQ